MARDFKGGRAAAAVVVSLRTLLLSLGA